MSRRGARISRALAVLLVFVLLIGLSFYFIFNGRSTPAEPEPVVAVNPANTTAPNPNENTLYRRDSATTETPRTPPAIATTVTPTAPVAAPVTLSADPAPAAQPTSEAQPAAERTPAVDRPLNPNALPEGQAALDAGKLVEARRILNDALLTGKLDRTSEREAKDLIAEANQTLFFSKQVASGDTLVEQYTIQPNDRLAKIAFKNHVPWEIVATINGIADPGKIRVGQKIKVPHGPIHAVVDKSDYTLDLYFNSPGGPDSVYITTLSVGLGADNSTPTGLWKAEGGKKVTNPVYYSPRGEGIIPANDPTNPLGEYWIGLVGIEGQAVGKESYGIHGTIEPETIGTQASMGCIRLRDADIKLVYECLSENKSHVLVKD